MAGSGLWICLDRALPDRRQQAGYFRTSVLVVHQRFQNARPDAVGEIEKTAGRLGGDWQTLKRVPKMGSYQPLAPGVAGGCKNQKLQAIRSATHFEQAPVGAA